MMREPGDLPECWYTSAGSVLPFLEKTIFSDGFFISSCFAGAFLIKAGGFCAK